MSGDLDDLLRRSRGELRRATGPTPPIPAPTSEFSWRLRRRSRVRLAVVTTAVVAILAGVGLRVGVTDGDSAVPVATEGDPSPAAGPTDARCRTYLPDADLPSDVGTVPAAVDVEMGSAADAPVPGAIALDGDAVASGSGQTYRGRVEDEGGVVVRGRDALLDDPVASIAGPCRLLELHIGPDGLYVVLSDDTEGVLIDLVGVGGARRVAEVAVPPRLVSTADGLTWALVPSGDTADATDAPSGSIVCLSFGCPPEWSTVRTVDDPGSALVDVAESGIWTEGDGQVHRLDPATMTLDATIEADRLVDARGLGVWVRRGERLEGLTATGDVLLTYDLPADPTLALVGGPSGVLWAEPAEGDGTRIRFVPHHGTTGVEATWDLDGVEAAEVGLTLLDTAWVIDADGQRWYVPLVP